tara:strand:- start:292 stop:513 length:222 start_codon:yes stop_codon:yes gene_type:complete
LSSVFGEGKTFVPLLLLGRRRIYYSDERHAPQRRTNARKNEFSERERESAFGGEEEGIYYSYSTTFLLEREKE